MEWTFLTCLPRKYEERREEEDKDDNVAKGHGLPKFITHFKFTLNGGIYKLFRSMPSLDDWPC